MKTVCKKLLCLMLVAMLLVSAVPFQVSADEVDPTATTAAPETTTEAPSEAATTTAPETATEAPTTEAPTTEAPTTEGNDGISLASEGGNDVPTPQDSATTTIVPDYNITLWADDSLSSASTHPVKIGQPYGAIQTLPKYSRDHEIHVGWKLYGTTTIVDDATIVQNNAVLSGVWTRKQYDVTIKYLSSNSATATWDTYTTVKVQALDPFNNLPAGSEVTPDGLEFIGWMTEDGTDFTPGTKITGNTTLLPRYKCKVTLKIENYSDKTSTYYRDIDVEIGKKISFPDPGARGDYAFSHWKTADGTQVTTYGSLVSTNPYSLAQGTVFVAEYGAAKVIRLHIHTNRSGLQTAASIVEYYNVLDNEWFYTSSLDMYDIFPSYTAYDEFDAGDKAYGWFDRTNWDRFCANRGNAANANAFKISEQYTDLYIMLYDSAVDASSTNTYNTNTSTLDTSNPKTGDYIMMAVTVLAVSGAALAVIFYMKKRKASK